MAGGADGELYVCACDGVVGAGVVEAFDAADAVGGLGGLEVEVEHCAVGVGVLLAPNPHYVICPSIVRSHWIRRGYNNKLRKHIQPRRR